MAHSEIGASSMERWKNCAGSVALSRGLPNISTEYAQEGTIAHEYCSEWLQKGILPPGNLDDETYEAVATYVEHVQNLWKSLERHSLSKIMIEHKFDLSSIYEGLYGTADCVIYDGKNEILYVIDYKHGKGIPVSPLNNPQLMYYGLGALLSLSVPIKRVVLQIVQPRFSSDLEQSIKSAEIDAIDMMDFKTDLYEFAKATDEKDAPLVIGDHCQFCKARAICPALQSEARVAVNADFAPDKLSHLDPEVLASLLDKVDAIEFWVKGVREFAYQEAKVGRVPPGYKLVPKRASRKWANVDEAMKTLERSVQATVLGDCLTAPELKSPTQVEKVLGKANKPLVDSLTVLLSSGDTLVHESDIRETSSSVKAREMFASTLLD